MAYIPPTCDSISFTLNGVYTPPACDMLNFDIGGTAPHEILTSDVDILIDAETAEFFQGDMIRSSNAEIALESEDSFLDPMVPISSAYASILTQFDLHDIEILPDIITENINILLDFDEGLIRGTEDHHLPTETSVGKRNYPWVDANPDDDRLCMSFGKGEDIYQHITFPVQDPSIPDIHISCSWITQIPKDIWNCISFEDFYSFDLSTCSSYINWMDYVDNHYSKCWGANNEKIDWKFCVPYNEPGPHDIKKCSTWDTADLYDWHFCVPWNEPGAWDTEKCTAWGPFSYYTLCSGEGYQPPRACRSINFAFPSKYDLIGNVCSNITFFLDDTATDPDPRCPWDHVHSGIRDRYPGIILPDIQFPPAKKVYYMLNTVLVKEILTNQPIEVLQVDATIDRDSWLWQFNVTVASRDCLEVIRPKNGVYSHIQIDINGYSWICTVESWRENRSFGKDSWTVTGRSPSIMFASPIATKQSDTETVAKQGRTIFDDIVSDGSYIPANWPAQLSSWQGEWGAYNNTCTGFDPHASWYVPENTLSYTDKTPIEVLQDITSAIGAYIQTDPSQNILHVKPMYAWQPWDWDSSNTNIEWKPIIEDQCKEIARNTKLQPYYQAIHVMGENIGGSNDGTGSDSSNTACFVDIIRDGYSRSTATYAPMVTHPLVTSSKAGLEKGRMVLGNTGEWIEHTLRLGVLCPNSDSMGLFLPGDMITVLERGYPWYGQVTSTTISARTVNKTFVVDQQIDVEEFVNS